MAIPILGDIIQAVGNLAGKALDKIAGDKIDEATKEKLKAELRLELAKMDFSAYEKQIDDQVDARALAKVEAEKAPWLIRIFNGVVRPYGGFISLTVFFYTILYAHLGKFTQKYWGITLDKLEFVDWQWIILLSIIGFFFGLRELSKSKGIQNRF